MVSCILSWLGWSCFLLCLVDTKHVCAAAVWAWLPRWDMPDLLLQLYFPPSTCPCMCRYRPVAFPIPRPTTAAQVSHRAWEGSEQQ